MVMGLINYPELGDTSEKIEEELDYYRRLAISFFISFRFILIHILLICFILLQNRRHTNIILKRIFVFNFSFELSSVNGLPCLPPRGLHNDPSSLVIFPPEGS
jgi:hypothetical protein